MANIKYKIYELSVRAILAHAKVQADGSYTFHLGAKLTDRCKSMGATHEQEDNALFYQIMCELHKDDFTLPDDSVIEDLADIIFYADFTGIFDHTSQQKKYIERQKKAEAMFRPEGVTLDFGSGSYRYLAFERSGSMSRRARLSFIREDYYARIKERMMLGMHIGKCQLSKLYAYNGLMLSGGVRIDGVDIDKPHRVIVIDNTKRIIPDVKMITVDDRGSDAPVRKYYRKEVTEDIEITEFDGEGLISTSYAKVIDKVFCGNTYHTSFQIRMPYVKGMLHAVDFKDFIISGGGDSITDIFGVTHNVNDVDIILTKSMFKGYSWLKENNMTWDDYWAAFRKYKHALYITNVSKDEPQKFTELNYQFLNTVSITAEEFRPLDLPLGWKTSPENDGRVWLTKQTELAYYNYCANAEFRANYFLDILKARRPNKKSKKYLMARILAKNPLVIEEPIYNDELENMAETILKQYALGHLLVIGDNRFLSGDLLYFLTDLLPKSAPKDKRRRTFYSIAMTSKHPDDSFLASGAAYEHGNECTLLRNPHIARNEEALLHFYKKEDNLYKYYLGALDDIVMIDSFALIAERLGGADYDGDMVKTIADPIINKCVRRNYDVDASINFTRRDNIPLLKIPSVEPLIRDADDWYACFETVKNTFSARVGQISNAALDRSIIAYNENSDSELRTQCREETEILAILTGLEIDSAKSGVKPDLSAYLGSRDISRSIFLQYKKLIEEAEERRAWYEPTHREKLKRFFASVDWENVNSNLERLPYLAMMLKKHTPKIKLRTVSDSQLFTFAQEADWQKRLDPVLLSAVDNLLTDYENCLSRIRACRAPITKRQKEADINRILYSRNQEDEYDSDELYALFQNLSPERVAAIRKALTEEKWHLMGEDAREAFLCNYLPEEEFVPFYELLSDFRFGGYRILGDLICDMDDEFRALGNKQLVREGDSPEFSQLMAAYMEKSVSQYYKDAVTKKCRELLEGILKPGLAVRYVVALGKRKLIWELFLDKVEENILKVEEN